MAPRKKPLRERIDALTVPHGACLVWQGKLQDGRPYLRGVGNPARHLLNITDPRIQVRFDCPYHNPRCIEPMHQRVVVEQSKKYDDPPPPAWIDPRRATSEFSAQDAMEIEENLELLRKEEITREDLDGLPTHLKGEILLRAGLK